jgi:RNA-directed DNA polymerase
MKPERRGCIIQLYGWPTILWEELLSKAKPFSISKQVVWDAFKRVKANGGAAGVDGESIAEFASDLKGNLYKLWNRMSSGSYFPPPVRTVEIPKDNGGKRSLGIPSVSDRIAQMVVKMYLEPEVEPHFHQDSYGYRPGKSALEAVGVARQRCWRSPAVSSTAAQRMRHEMRSCRLHRRSDRSLEDLSHICNSIPRGWIAEIQKV